MSSSTSASTTPASLSVPTQSHASPVSVAGLAAGSRAAAAGVDLNGLHRTYGEVRALDGLDLNVAPGELVALLGPSGCGKTTALRIVAGFERPDSGSVLVGGVDVTSTPPAKRDMGMVFQSYSLFPHLSAADNVAFGLRIRGVSSACPPHEGPGAARPGRDGDRPLPGSRISSPAASSSGSRSRGRSRSSRPYCCSTSRCPRSTRRYACNCATRSGVSRSRSA